MNNLATLTWLVTGRTRGGRARLIGTAAGIALGAMLLLLVFSAYQGMTERAARANVYAQISGEPIHGDTQGTPSTLQTKIADGVRPSPGELITLDTGFGAGTETFRGLTIQRVDIAVSNDSMVTLPGIGGRLPGPGEYAASPALGTLIGQHPNDQLANRYGTAIGTISTAGLASPDTLLVVVGHAPSELASLSSAVITDTFTGQAFPSSAYLLLAIIGGLAVLFPVVVLISIVTQLGQAARADRFATLGLIGATPHRIAIIGAIETGTISVVGTVVGIACYRAILPLVAQVRVEGMRFFVSDLVLRPGFVVLAAVATILSATVAAYISARRNRGQRPRVGRGQVEPRPRPTRIIPLGVGVLLLAAAVVVKQGSAQAAPGTVSLAMQFVNLAVIPSFLLVIFGLVFSGPLVLYWVSTFLEQRTGSAAGVLALNRLRRHPSLTFRTVSGLILALFIVTVFSVAVTAADEDGSTGGAVAASKNRVALDSFLVFPQSLSDRDATRSQARELVTALADVPGSSGAYLLTQLPTDEENRFVLTGRDAQALGLDPPPGSDYVSVNGDYFSTFPREAPPIALEALSADEATLSLPMMIVVTTDGTADSIEQARTAIIAAPGADTLDLMSPRTLEELGEQEGSLSYASQFAGLANLGGIIAATISVVSLGVATVAGVIDRKRPLALLRLTGMPGNSLRRMIVWEASVPVAATFLLCIGLGVFVAWALVHGLSGSRTISWPTADYYAMITSCLLLACLSIATTFGTVRKTITTTETRFE